MLKNHILLIIGLFLFSSSLWATEMICQLVDVQGASTIKVEYVDDKPALVYLKSPESDQYRPQSVEIDIIKEMDEKGRENFNVKPLLEEDIDWSKEPRCYKQVGTQWNFDFNRETHHYFVIFAPYYVKSKQSCVTPRHTPQPHLLDCGSKSTRL